MKEMAYTPSQKDLTETKIKHMLSENLFMPRARVSKRMSTCVCEAKKLCHCTVEQLMFHKSWVAIYPRMSLLWPGLKRIMAWL